MVLAALSLFVGSAFFQQLDPPRLPEAALPYIGRWNLEITLPNRIAYGWLEVESSGYNTLVGRYVGTGGSARPISSITFKDGGISFPLPPQWERNPLSFEAKLEDGALKGTVVGYAGSPRPFLAKRAPALVRPEPKWGEPTALFNGKDLEGWTTTRGRANRWSVQNGHLAAGGGGANLVSDERFEDFKVLVEFRYPEGSNSGIYLRGRYEVQIEDGHGRPAHRHGPGSIYGFFEPSENAARPAGEWQQMEITLVGRRATVVYNGKAVLQNVTIPGMTGGALDNHEEKPGPILIQGDHGPIEFRKIEVTRPAEESTIPRTAQSFRPLP